MGEYQGSQAFAQITSSNESINRNTGSLNFSKSLVNLRGISKSINVSLDLSYSAGLSGSFGLPKNWTFNIPYVIPYRSLTTQNRTYVLDPNWADVKGYKSGLRYINNHGIKFERVNSNLVEPSGSVVTYSWRFTQTDGAVEYFDESGKLIQHADVFGNSLYYFYKDPQATPLTATIDYILDSWGQKIVFKYKAREQIEIITPDGGVTQIDTSPGGVQKVTDPAGYITTLSYSTVASQTVLWEIQHPNTLVSKFFYQTIPYYDANGQRNFLPAVRRHYHYDDNGLELNCTEYTFGGETGGNNYTGYPQYRMGSAKDSLMDTNNPLFRYDALIKCLDTSGNVLTASGVQFNSLHLPMRELHYQMIQVDGKSQYLNAYRADYSYKIAGDQHARSTAYTQPITTVQSHWNPATSSWRNLRQATASYDDYGCMRENGEELWDTSLNAFVKQRTVSKDYTATSWGGQMLLSETYRDELTQYQRQLIYNLTEDKKSIKTSAVLYRAKGDSDFRPWKTKTFAHDKNGRITSEETAWSTEGLVPSETVSSYTNTISYGELDTSSGTTTVTNKDPQGHKTITTYSTRLRHGPIVTKTLPLGQTESFDYDKLSRIVLSTDPFGNKTKTTFSVGAVGNKVTSTSPLGYVTETTFDPLGRQIQLSDNGDSSKPRSPIPNRILSKTTYDSLSRIATKTDELGLTTIYNSYDSFNRVLKLTDPLGNVTTNVIDDVELITTKSLNGDLRSKSQIDGFGRTIKTTTYADSGDPFIDYHLINSSVYDGFDNVIKRSLSQKSGSVETVLQTCEQEYTVESSIYTSVTAGKSTDLNDKSFDSVVRRYVYDIFGHVHSSSKTVQYSDGNKEFSWQGPKDFYDTCGQLVCHRNQLSQEETYTYDDNGFVTSMTRFDNTKTEFSTDAIGRVVGINGPSSSLTKKFLANGRLSETQQGNDIIQYQYQLDGCANAVIYPGDQKQSYKLDGISRIFQDEDVHKTIGTTRFDEKGRIYSRSRCNDTIIYTYDTVNHTFGQLSGDSMTGGQNLKRTITYDGFSRPKRVLITNRQLSAVVSESRYLYDSRGRLLEVEQSSQTAPSSPEVNYRREYSYDGLGQLKTDSITYTKTGIIKKSQYMYDGNSNVISATINGVTKLMNYNELDQRVDCGFSYDQNGRLLSDDEGRRYSYNENDQLTSVELSAGASSNFQFHPTGAMSVYNSDNGDGTVQAENLYYDGGAVNAISANGTKTSFLLESGRRLAGYEGDSYTPTYFVENQGSTALLLGESGNKAIEYQPYGSSTTSAPVGQMQSSFGYRQEFTDGVSGLVYLRSRFYQPSHMAFITMDSTHKDNRYAYCDGDPINLIDSTGHASTGGMAAGLAVGIAVTVIAAALTGGIAATVFGPECIAANIAAAAITGAVGNLAGDGTQATIDHEFSLARAGEDLLAGAVGGAVGAGVGGFAGSQAMSMALSREMSQQAITRIGIFTSGIVGGAAGSLASTGTTDLLTHQPFFSANTAISTVTGGLAGFGGGVFESGSYWGVYDKHIIPVPLKASEKGLIIDAEMPGAGQGAGRRAMFATFNSSENDLLAGDWSEFRLRPGEADGALYDTVTVHGSGNTVFPGVSYKGETDYMRPMKGKLFAEHVAELRSAGRFGTPGTPVKLLSCHGAFWNAQELADALQVPVYGTYWECTSSDNITVRRNPRAR